MKQPENYFQIVYLYNTKKISREEMPDECKKYMAYLRYLKVHPEYEDEIKDLSEEELRKFIDEHRRKLIGSKQKATWSNEEYKNFRSDLTKNQWKNKTPEELEIQIQRQKDTWKNKSDEEKEIHANHTREQWANYSDEEKAVINKKHSETLKQDEYREKLIERGRAYWNTLSNEERNRRIEILHEGLETWKENLTDEEKAQLLSNLSERMKLAWSKKSKEERSAIGRKGYETFCQKSDEEIEETRRKMSISHKKYLSSLSDEEMNRIVDRIRKANIEYWKNVSPEDKEKFIKNLLAKSKKWREGLSEEEKQLMAEKMSKLHKAIFDNMDDEKKEIIRTSAHKWWASLPDSEKEKIRMGQSIKSLKMWENPSPQLIASARANGKRLRRDYITWRNSLSQDEKDYYSRKLVLPAHSNNRLNIHFEKMFTYKLYQYEVYYESEHLIRINDNKHFWDYGIFDYSNNLVCLVDIDGAYFHADDNNDYDGIHSKYEYDIKRGESIPPNTKHCIIREKHFNEDFQWLLNILPLSYEEFVKEEVKYLCTMPFPYPSYSDITLLQSWNSLIKMNLDNKHYSSNFQVHLGDHIVYHFCHSLYDERIWKPEWIEEAVRSHMIYHPHMNHNKLLLCVPHEEFTPPGQARILLKDHTGEYVDDKCDVGMMLGCIASGIPYRTTCTNMSRYNEIYSILEWFDKYKIKHDKCFISK